MLPNVYFNEIYGKFIFSILDMICAVLIYRILIEDLLNLKLTYKQCIRTVMYYLYNPVIINVCTRGSSEAIVTLFVLLTLYYLLKRKIVVAGILFGFSYTFWLCEYVYLYVLFIIFCFII